MLTKRSVRTFAAFAALLFSLALAAFAQAPGTGALVGVVIDPTGRALANVDVTATSLSTHVTRDAVTTSEGIFRFPLLAPGGYDITVTSSGFRTGTVRAVRVVVSESANITVKLELANVTTTIDVTFASTPTDTESSTLGGLVDGKAIQSLPLSTRNFTQTLGLAPGVIVDVPFTASLGNGSQNVASNGAIPTANNFQFNGVDANNLVENSAAAAQNFQVGVAIPSPDSIAEFKIQTANYTAAYGRGSGANVDLVTRSGSNQFHGAAWEFVRNNLFNANSFFNKQSNQPRPALKQNEFGAAFGGPLLRDRLFFFGSYQGIRQVNGFGDSKTTTLPRLTDNRSAAALGALFCPANHLNSHGQPASGYGTEAGGTQVACDGSNINPVALKILNTKLANGQFAIPNPQILLPNTSSGGSDPLDQFQQGQSTFSLPAHYNENQFMVDLDGNLSSRNTLSGRFFYSKSIANTPLATANVPGWATDSAGENTMFVLSDTHTLRPSLLNVARFGFIRFDGLSSVESPLTAASIGQATPTGAISGTAPAITIGGVVLGDGGTPNQYQVTDSYIYQDTVAYTRGHHNLAFGVEFKHYMVAEDQPQQASGNVFVDTWDDFLVGQSASTNGSPFGLSNVSGSVAGGGLFRRDERYNDFAAFAQDDFKLTQRLTVNAGLRYEIFGAPREIHGRLPNFIPALAQQGPLSSTGTFKGLALPSNFVGTVPSGVTVQPFAGFYQTPKLDFEPRIGFSYALTSDKLTVIRGGYGIYYDKHSGNVAEQTIGQLPFASLQFAFGPQAAAGTLQNPFTPQVLPNSAYPLFQPFTDSTFNFIEGTNPNIKDGRTDEYNLNVQRALGKSFLFEVGYVGTRSVHRPGQVEFSQALLASPTHPVFGETTNSIGNSTVRMPYQGISAGSLYSDSVFSGNYNALQTTVSRRMTHGFQMQASYTWSKNLDEVNGEGTNPFELNLPTNDQNNLRASSYGPASDDRTHRFVINFLYQAPSLRNAPFLVRQTLAHWEFSGIGVIQSGLALSVFDGNAGSVYALLGGETRAQRATGKITTEGSDFSRVTGSGRWLSASAFTRAPEAPFGTSLADQDFGNSGVGLTRGPGQGSLDFAVERLFPIHERLNIHFRAEAFNLTNTPQFGNPNTTLGYGNPANATPTASTNFGRISAEQGGPHPRILQLAAKLTF